MVFVSPTSAPSSLSLGLTIAMLCPEHWHVPTPWHVLMVTTTSRCPHWNVFKVKCHAYLQMYIYAYSFIFCYTSVCVCTLDHLKTIILYHPRIPAKNSCGPRIASKKPSQGQVCLVPSDRSPCRRVLWVFFCRLLWGVAWFVVPSQENLTGKWQ